MVFVAQDEIKGRKVLALEVEVILLGKRIESV